MARIVVGLSGGVDSSVAAYLLQKEGHEVIGVFMRNWNDESVTINNECPWIDDSNDALMVAEHLGIPFQVIDFSEQYKERIVDYMFREYQAGRTPNPDVLCNREVKFDLFLDLALQLGAEFVATGHYCQKAIEYKDGQEVYQLMAGKDPNKDQSYFLCQVNQYQLSKALFPIGHLLKPEVRAIAEQAGIPTAQKKDSQGLCFIGKVSLPEFLQQQLEIKKGKILMVPPQDIEIKNHEIIDCHTLEDMALSYAYNNPNYKEVGVHNGAHFFTIGQRKGLGVGGLKEPAFVLATDVDENIIYVGEGESHPGLYKHALFIKKEELHWINPDFELKVGESADFEVRIRYRQKLRKAVLFQFEEGVYIYFPEAEKAITSGQFAAFYQDGQLVGSGVIHH